MADVVGSIIEALIMFAVLPALAGGIAVYVADNNSSAVGIVVASVVEVIVILGYVRALWKKSGSKGK